MASSNGNISRVTAPLLGESNGHGWIILTNDVWRGALMFHWSGHEPKFEQKIETPVTWNAVAHIVTSLLWERSNFETVRCIEAQMWPTMIWPETGDALTTMYRYTKSDA